MGNSINIQVTFPCLYNLLSFRYKFLIAFISSHPLHESFQFEFKWNSNISEYVLKGRPFHVCNFKRHCKKITITAPD